MGSGVRLSRSLLAVLAVCSTGLAQRSEEVFAELYRWRESQAMDWVQLAEWCRTNSLPETAETAAIAEAHKLLPQHAAARDLGISKQAGPRTAGPRTAGTEAQYTERVRELRERQTKRTIALATRLVERKRFFAADWVLRRLDPSMHARAADLARRLDPMLKELAASHDAIIARAKSGKVKGGGVADMDYWFSLPPDFRADRLYPIFVMNHGNGGNGRQYVDVAGEFAFRRTCIVVGPSRRRPARWGDIDLQRADCERILRIVSRMVVRYRGDPTRVFIAGHSWGGGICYSAAAEFPRHFAGVLHVFGNFYSRAEAFRETRRPVLLPILVLRGEHDQYNHKWYDPQRKIAFAELAKAGYRKIDLQHVKGASHGDARLALRQSGPWIEAIAGEELLRGVRLGIRFRAQEGGLRVTEVTPGSRADRGGLRAGDVIRKVDGRAVTTGTELRAILIVRKPSATIPCHVARRKDGATLVRKVELAGGPPAPRRER